MHDDDAGRGVEVPSGGSGVHVGGAEGEHQRTRIILLVTANGCMMLCACPDPALLVDPVTPCVCVELVDVTAKLFEWLCVDPVAFTEKLLPWLCVELSLLTVTLCSWPPIVVVENVVRTVPPCPDEMLPSLNGPESNTLN